MGGDSTPISELQLYFSFVRHGLILVPQSLVSRLILWGHEVEQEAANHGLSRRTQQLRQAEIAVNDTPAIIQHRGSLLHFFNQGAVRKIGPLQRVNPMAFRLFDDERVHS